RSLREKVEKAEQRRMTDYGQFTSDDIEDLAHEEFLEDNVHVLGEMLDKILVQQITPLSFSQLSRKNPMDRISVFIALLFLESRGEIEMYQEEFYGELFIRKPEISPEISNDAIIPETPVENPTGKGEAFS
ncbi:MAG: segregation/condensation protein A, partial [Cyanobacteria bacterium]|nr:segregation/condensation protein A [Cyanobacteriota bacterium]